MTIQRLYESLRQHLPNLGFTEALALLNDASRDFASETKILDVDDTSLTTIADTASYTLPTELFRLNRIWIGDDEAIKMIGNWIFTDSTINSEKFFWQLDEADTKIRITYDDGNFSYPSASLTIKIRAKRYDDVYTAETDTPLFPSEFHVALLYKILADLYMRPEMLNLNVSIVYRAEYDKRLRQARKYAKSIKTTAGAPTPVYY